MFRELVKKIAGHCCLLFCRDDLIDPLPEHGAAGLSFTVPGKVFARDQYAFVFTIELIQVREVFKHQVANV